MFPDSLILKRWLKISISFLRDSDKNVLSIRAAFANDTNLEKLVYDNSFTGFEMRKPAHEHPIAQICNVVHKTATTKIDAFITTYVVQ